MEAAIEMDDDGGLRIVIVPTSSSDILAMTSFVERVGKEPPMEVTRNGWVVASLRFGSPRTQEDST